MKKYFLLILSCFLFQQVFFSTLAKADAMPTSDRNNGAFFTGIDFASRATYGYIGTVYALDAPLGETGWLLRGFLGYGRYKYSDITDGIGTVTGKITDVNLQIGYEILFGQNNLVSFFIGPNYQRNKLSPSIALSDTKGSRYGAQFGLEASTDKTAPFDAEFDGLISTANTAYWTRLRLGWLALQSTRIGPEVNLMGSKSYHDNRFGGFAEMHFEGWSVALYGGYSNKDGDDADRKVKGGYGGLTLGMVY